MRLVNLLHNQRLHLVCPEDDAADLVGEHELVPVLDDDLQSLALPSHETIAVEIHARQILHAVDHALANFRDVRPHLVHLLLRTPASALRVGILTTIIPTLIPCDTPSHQFPDAVLPRSDVGTSLIIVVEVKVEAEGLAPRRGVGVFLDA